MRVTQEDTNRSEAPKGPQTPGKTAPKRALDASRADLIPLYDHEPFLFLVERERARADRAAARPPKPPRKLATAPALAAASATGAPKAAQPKPSSEGVWGATTDNREFSLVIFRPRSRADRAGLVELLQACVRTTDAVGVVDARRLGVLLPDTAANNATLFVKKVLALAAEQEVHLSHIVHTYPAAWPDEDSPLWNEPRRSKDDETAEPAASNGTSPVQSLSRTQRRSADRSVLSGLVNWLQSAAARRPARREVRASA
jgi:hypothetical protein